MFIDNNFHSWNRSLVSTKLHLKIVHNMDIIYYVHFTNGNMSSSKIEIGIEICAIFPWKPWKQVLVLQIKQTLNYFKCHSKMALQQLSSEALAKRLMEITCNTILYQKQINYTRNFLLFIQSVATYICMYLPYICST